MSVLCYEITGECLPHPRSTTGAELGQIAAILKGDHQEANRQIYSELAANRLAAFLGIPVVTGVVARSAEPGSPMRFAGLKAAESGLDMYDFTADPDERDDEELEALPEGMHKSSGHVAAIIALCAKYPLEVSYIAVFDLWICNQDRVFNFKAELKPEKAGVIFALDHGSSLLACRATVDDSIDELARQDRPCFHPFQKLVNPLYCGAMVERIANMPDWAINAATTFDDTIGDATLPEQYATAAALLERRKFLGEMVQRVLF
ncbi:MAG: hypothetical protein V4650_01225 [Pseudomonadota bacterium]